MNGNCRTAKSTCQIRQAPSPLTFQRGVAYLIDAMITVTDSAFRRLNDLITENPEYRGKGLRISVETGGCAGMQYGMQFDEAKPGDQCIEQNGVEVLIDGYSADFLAGATVDYVDGLTGAGFKILNPNIVRSCGCGSSFEVARET
jgi:iron-sulfur cluster assembly accessory protein